MKQIFDKTAPPPFRRVQLYFQNHQNLIYSHYEMTKDKDISANGTRTQSISQLLTYKNFTIKYKLAAVFGWSCSFTIKLNYPYFQFKFLNFINAYKTHLKHQANSNNSKLSS